MKKMSIAIILSLLTASCAGQSPTLVASSQVYDDTAPCSTIRAEIAQNDSKMQQLASQRSNKVAYNTAIGVAGLFLWPVWFAADFKSDENAEINALQQRNASLRAMQADRCAEQASAR